MKYVLPLGDAVPPALLRRRPLAVTLPPEEFGDSVSGLHVELTESLRSLGDDPDYTYFQLYGHWPE